MRILILSLLLIGVTPAVFAKAKELHSNVVADTERLEDGRLRFSFKVTTDILMNYQAPWLLKFKDEAPLVFEQKQWKEPDLKKVWLDQKTQKKDKKQKKVSDDMRKSKEASFVVETKTAVDSSKAGEVEFRMNAFVCTDGKTRCYRDVHKGKVSWTAKPPRTAKKSD